MVVDFVVFVEVDFVGMVGGYVFFVELYGIF